MKDFDQGNIRKVSVQGGGGSANRFLDRMHGKDQGHSPRIADTIAQARDGLQVGSIAGGKIVCRLRDSDDRPTGLEFTEGHSVIEESFDIQRRHSRVARVVPPLLGSQVREFHGSGSIGSVGMESRGRRSMKESSQSRVDPKRTHRVL